MKKKKYSPEWLEKVCKVILIGIDNFIRTLERIDHFHHFLYEPLSVFH